METDCIAVLSHVQDMFVQHTTYFFVMPYITLKVVIGIFNCRDNLATSKGDSKSAAKWISKLR